MIRGDDFENGDATKQSRLMSKSDVAILCVDDEEPNVLLFKMIFEKKYCVLTAASAEDGLEVLRSSSDDIVAVFSDMWMPNMNGLEFIREARKMHDRVGYFILSSYLMNDEMKEAVDQNIVDGFFLKPFNTDEIENCIQGSINPMSANSK